MGFLARGQCRRQAPQSQFMDIFPTALAERGIKNRDKPIYALQGSRTTGEAGCTKAMGMQRLPFLDPAMIFMPQRRTTYF